MALDNLNKIRSKESDSTIRGRLVWVIWPLPVEDSGILYIYIYYINNVYIQEH